MSNNAANENGYIIHSDQPGATGATGPTGPAGSAPSNLTLETVVGTGNVTSNTVIFQTAPRAILASGTVTIGTISDPVLDVDTFNKRVGINTTSSVPSVTTLDVRGTVRGLLAVLKLNDGIIKPEHCYGDTIYSSGSGGALQLPKGEVGMHLWHTNDSGGNITVKVPPDNYMNGVQNSSFTLNPSNTLVHKFICSAQTRWFSSS